MTLQEWLGTRTPAPPPALAARVVALVDASADRQVDAPLPEQCIAVAEHALRDLLTADALARDSALDLLAIDALVTYAFEAAALEPTRITALALQAMERLSIAVGA